jgi:hypothetical protein
MMVVVVICMMIRVVAFMMTFMMFLGVPFMMSAVGPMAFGEGCGQEDAKGAQRKAAADQGVGQKHRRSPWVASGSV